MHKRVSIRILPTIVLGWCSAFFSAQSLVIYPAIDALPRSMAFIVKVRNPGGVWKAVPVYQVKVADGRGARTITQESAMAYFDFSGRVEIAITAPAREFSSVHIRPFSDSIEPVVKHHIIHLGLDRPRNLSIELDGDRFHNLQLFAGSPETTVPDKADTNVVYFGPGVHDTGTVRLTSGKRVYLAGGAVVEGQFLIDHQENIGISGRGILLQSGRGAAHGGRRDALRIDFSRNVTVDDIIVIPNTYTVLIGSSQNVRIRHIKSMSCGGNNDGIDVFCSSDVVIDGVFMRNSDDCIAIYGHRWGYYGNTRDVTVRHSILWADVAHPILVGTHGDPVHPDTLEELHFSDIDILDQQEHQVDYQGCMSLNAGDSNLIRKVCFEDIRVEDFRQGQLVNLRVMYNKKYNTAPGKGIEDILFKDIRYHGSHAGLSIISGYDDCRPVRNVIFRNLRINNELIFDTMPGKPAWYKTADLAGFYVGEHVDGLKFEK